MNLDSLRGMLMDMGIARKVGVIATGLLFAAGQAHAHPAANEVAMRIHVGDTASLDVGFARGLVCDDVTMIRVELRGETPTSNRFFVTGVHPGTTLCRVGTMRGTPADFLVHITVYA